MIRVHEDDSGIIPALADSIPGAEMVLRAGETRTFGYSMRMNRAGSAELPPAVVHFVDTHDYDGTVVSEKTSITVNPAQDRLVHWLDSLLRCL